MKRSFKRNVVVSLVVLTVVLAGCVGGGGTPTPEADDGNDAGDGSDGDASGGDGGDGSGDGSGDSGDGDGSDGDGADGSGSDDATATDGMAGSTPTSSPSPTSSPTATTTGSGPSGSVSGPSLGDLLQFEDSYRFRMEASQMNGESVDVQQSGRFDGSDTYFKSTAGGRTTEIYLIGDVVYMETGGQCQEITEQWTQQQDPGNWSQSDYYGDLDVQPSATTTIDGEEMYVYEVDYDRQGLEGPFTYYVNAETGHIHKQESPHATIEMWSWGDVEPVEAPC